MALLEAIREHGSISAAARDLGMAYRHAWELIDDMNRAFDSPVVRAASGGRAGGGARLTRLGRSVALRFRAMEAAARRHRPRPARARPALARAGRGAAARAEPR